MSETAPYARFLLGAYFFNKGGFFVDVRPAWTRRGELRLTAMMVIFFVVIGGIQSAVLSILVCYDGDLGVITSMDSLV